MKLAMATGANVAESVGLGDFARVDEYSKRVTARKHLMANMPGDAAFKNGRPKPEDVLPDETETTTLTNEAGQVPGLTV